jgi:hypothetical protein
MYIRRRIMKKIVAFLLAISMVFTFFCFTASAASLDEIFDNGLWVLDAYYNYNVNYIVSTINQKLYVFDENDYEKPTVVTAEEYETLLNKYFYISDDMLTIIRNYEDSYILKYSAEEGTYALRAFGGFGGSLAPRVYMFYIENGDGTYDVYYQQINYEFLEDVLPEGVNVHEYAESLDWPSEIEYGGNTYENGMDGYYRIHSYSNNGRKYTVSINDDETLRIISATTFVESDLPECKSGDINEDYRINADDAIYLLYNVFFGKENYPVNQSCDFDGDSTVDADDAIYLLYHVFFGEESYPLTPKKPENEWTGNY